MSADERKISLVVMAAGIGSRFSGGIKQLVPVGLNGEVIMDYSVHDAIEAGFNKIIFIIRKDIEDAFHERIGNRVESICHSLGIEVLYAFQDLHSIPAGHVLLAGRTKPWGTGQAVLAAKDLIREPFAVLNADDYYGKEAFRSIHSFLSGNSDPRSCCMAGFILKNTLSDHGGVTRGICQVDENDLLQEIVETRDIVKTAQGASAGEQQIDVNSEVSMNMWGLMPEFIGLLEEGFDLFFKRIAEGTADPDKAEFLLPVYIGELLKEKQISVKVLKTTDRWFGVTYLEDRDLVKQGFEELLRKGVYKKDLYAELLS